MDNDAPPQAIQLGRPYLLWLGGAGHHISVSITKE